MSVVSSPAGYSWNLSKEQWAWSLFDAGCWGCVSPRGQSPLLLSNSAIVCSSSYTLCSFRCHFSRYASVTINTLVPLVFKQDAPANEVCLLTAPLVPADPTSNGWQEHYCAHRCVLNMETIWRYTRLCMLCLTPCRKCIRL